MVGFAIEIEALRVRFGETVALENITLSVLPGELLILLGPSGCGKSSLLRSIAGFVQPDSGTIRIHGQDVTRLLPHERNIGMVFQSFALFPHLSVGENVAFGLRERKVSKGDIGPRVDGALRAVRLESFGARRVDQLSGGEQQRVALARALVTRPRCLLLDEPLSNLDAALRHGMREEIRRVCKEHQLTTLYVTHDQKEAMAVADRIAVLEGGKLLQLGTPAEVYRHPASRRVATFLGETNLLPGVVIERRDSGLVVSSALGDLCDVQSTAFEVGDHVLLSIRPEALRAHFDPGERCANGTLLGSTYLGELTLHRISVNDAEVRCFELNPPAMVREIGAQVGLSLASKDVVLFAVDDP